MNIKFWERIALKTIVYLILYAVFLGLTIAFWVYLLRK